MIAQSHIKAVNPAVWASPALHDSLCQLGLQLRRKPFAVVPRWSEAASPGVLCSHSLSEQSRRGSYLQAHPQTA